MSFHLWSLRNALCHFGLKDQSSDHFQVETPCPPTLFRQGWWILGSTHLCVYDWTLLEGACDCASFDLLPLLRHSLRKTSVWAFWFDDLFHLQITYLIWVAWHSYFDFAWVWILLRDCISRPFRSTAHPMPRAVCSKKVCVACFGMFILIYHSVVCSFKF